MHSDESPMRHLKYICDKIGSRPLGSDGNHEMASYIQSHFMKCNLQQIDKQNFHCPNWQLRKASIEFRGESSTVLSNRFSKSCDLTAPTISISTMSELEDTDLQGKVAVFYGEIIRLGFIPKAFKIYNPEINQRLVRLCEDKKPSAIITVANTTENILPIIRDWDFSIPSVTVNPEIGLTLLDCTEPIRIRIISTTTDDESCNLFAKKINDRRDRIVLCAHYDTEFNCPGAVDNGVGVATLLALAEKLSTMQLSTDLEFIAFSGEEFAALGEQKYLDSHPDFENMLAVINLDGIGQKLGNNTITAMSSSNELETELRRLRDIFPQVSWIEPWYESDHTIFAFQGVPSIPMNSLGIKDIYHLPKDQIKWVSPEKLDEVMNLVVEIINMLQDKTTNWCRQSK